MGAALRRSIVVASCLAALAACGEHGEGSSAGRSVAPSPTGSAAAGDVEFFVDAGATEEEATCLAIALGEQEPSGGSGIEAIMADFTAAAEDCVEESRRAELTAAVEERVTEELDAVADPLREELAAQVEVAGATADEAECIAAGLLSADPEDLPLYGTTAKKAEIAVKVFRANAGDCVAGPKLEQIARAWVLGPQIGRLEQAGATKSEVRCFVEEVGELDLFLPSPDFNGPRATELGGDRIVEQMGDCLPERRVREIVRQAFRTYVKGCEKTSEDPLAPYEC